MSAPTFVASADATLATAGTGPLTCTKPTGTANGDLLLWHVAVASQAGLPTVPGGWDLIATNVITGGRTYVYARVASSEGASYDVSFSIASEANSIIHAYRPSAGAWSSVADAIAAVVISPNASTATPPVYALPVVSSDYMLVAFLAHGRGSTTTTAPTGYTLAGNPDSGGTGNSATESAGAYKAVTGGLAPATTWTLGNGGTNTTVHIALADPGAARRAIRSHRATYVSSSLTASPDMPRVIKAGDRLVAVLNRTTTAAVTPPSGWSQRTDLSYNTAADAVGVWEKVADGSEVGTNPTFTAASGTPGWACWVLAFRDSGPIVYAAAADASADTTVDIPALTMAAQSPGAIVVACCCESRGDHIPTTPPSGYAFLSAEISTSATNQSIGSGAVSTTARMGLAFLATTGANPAATTYTHDNSSVAAGVHIGTADASGGTPGGSGFYSYMIE